MWAQYRTWDMYVPCRRAVVNIERMHRLPLLCSISSSLAPSSLPVSQPQLTSWRINCPSPWVCLPNFSTYNCSLLQLSSLYSTPLCCWPASLHLALIMKDTCRDHTFVWALWHFLLQCVRAVFSPRNECLYTSHLQHIGICQVAACPYWLWYIICEAFPVSILSYWTVPAHCSENMMELYGCVAAMN